MRWRSDSDMETIAATVSDKLRRGTESPGVAFARKTFWDDIHQRKNSARGAIVQHFVPWAWQKPLTMLTLPGSAWKFERALLRHREPSGLKTELTCLERDPAVFVVAVLDMPGNSSGYVQHVPDRISAAHLSTGKIGSFLCTSFEDFAEDNIKVFDAAWIDLTGPLTSDVLRAFSQFWPCVRTEIVVTSLRARWTGNVGRRVANLGVAGVLASIATGSVVECDYDYMDTSPMSQVTLRRTDE